ncbi:MAG: sugar phosphate nucleotidyltransferase, partial [bacterium]|nr:sugar phosphate nucleotidyltransferase [bacterium]
DVYKRQGVAKPMIPVGGRPFLEWQLEWLRREGVEEVVLSLGYRAEEIEGHFRVERVKGVRVRWVKEEEALGTGGGARLAAHVVETAWCVVCNGDSLCPAGLGALRDAARREGVEVVMLVCEVDDVRDYGSVIVGEGGMVEGFVEKGSAAGRGVVNAGVYYVRTMWLRGLAERVPLSLEREVFPVMRQGQLWAVRADVPFLDIGVPERLMAAEAFIQKWVAGRECV